MESSLPVWFKTICSGIAAIGAYLFGGGDDWLYALIAFIVVDYITGVMAAAYLKKLSSGVGFKGLLRKVAIFAIVAVANVIDRSMHLNGAIRIVIICFFCANEGLSILENSAKMGLPIPQKLIDVLEQLKEKNKEGGHSDG